MRQHQVHLFGSQLSGGEIQRDRPLGRFLQSRANSFFRGPSLLGNDPGITDLVFALLDFLPIGVGKCFHGHGEEDVLFLVDHVID